MFLIKHIICYYHFIMITLEAHLVQEMVQVKSNNIQLKPN